jgi:hypothetical protein
MCNPPVGEGARRPTIGRNGFGRSGTVSRGLGASVRLVDRPRIGSNRIIELGGQAFESREIIVVDMELKRTARGVIDRIVQLRDSL